MGPPFILLLLWFRELVARLPGIHIKHPRRACVCECVWGPWLTRKRAVPAHIHTIRRNISLLFPFFAWTLWLFDYDFLLALFFFFFFFFGYKLVRVPRLLRSLNNWSRREQNQLDMRTITAPIRKRRPRHKTQQKPHFVRYYSAVAKKKHKFPPAELWQWTRSCGAPRHPTKRIFVSKEKPQFSFDFRKKNNKCFLVKSSTLNELQLGRLRYLLW